MDISRKHLLERVILSIVVAIVIEICVFNYQSLWSSDVYNKTVNASECGVVADYAEVDAEYGKYIALDSGAEGVCGVYFAPNCSVNNIRISAHGDEGDTVPVINSNNEAVYELSLYSLGLKIYGTQVGSSDIDTLYDGVIYDNGEGAVYNIPNKQYQYLYAEFSTLPYRAVYVENVELNVIPKMHFNILRCCIVFFIGLVVTLGGQVRQVFAKKCSYKYAFGIAAFFGILFFAMTFSNPISREANVSIDSYNDLAKALLQGKVTVYDEYAYSLDGIENVYDYEERNASGIFYLFDYAYYKGHYYVYFGVVPCILLYLPYMLITGKELLNSVVMALFIFGLCIGIGRLLYTLMNRYFDGCTRGRFLLGYVLITFMAQIPFLTSFPLVYQIAQCSGLFFSVLGLSFYVTAGDSRLTKHEDIYIAVGSLFIAFAVGCRPPYALLGLLAFPLLKDKMLLRNRSVVSKWGMFFAPYIIIAIPLMIYNYIRFGSVFAFGANYNLTNDNIVDITVSFNKIKAGFQYLFLELPHFTRRFPYIDSWIPDYDIDRQVKGTTGGFLVMNVLACVAIIPVFINKKDRKEVRLIQYLLIAISIFLGIFAVICSGCIERYKVDFGLWIGFATAVSCISLLDSIKSKVMKALLYLGTLQVVLSSCIFFFYSDILTLFEGNKVLYQSLYRFFIFWG